MTTTLPLVNKALSVVIRKNLKDDWDLKARQERFKRDLELDKKFYPVQETEWDFEWTLMNKIRLWIQTFTLHNLKERFPVNIPDFSKYRKFVSITYDYNERSRIEQYIVEISKDTLEKITKDMEIFSNNLKDIGLSIEWQTGNRRIENISFGSTNALVHCTYEQIPWYVYFDGFEEETGEGQLSEECTNAILSLFVKGKINFPFDFVRYEEGKSLLKASDFYKDFCEKVTMTDTDFYTYNIKGLPIQMECCSCFAGTNGPEPNGHITLI